jgi:hypothetical protein
MLVINMPSYEMFAVELIYTLVVVFLCFVVYYKTKGIYDLTKYKGIGYFRNAFLFFGLAYASRFILHLVQLTTFTFDFIIPKRMVFPLFMIPTGYFSTMAIFYLAYSIIWKKIKYEHFLTFGNTIAVILSAVAFISRSHILLSILQLLLLIFSIVLIIIKHKKPRKKLHTKALYILISIFWLINLFLLGPRRLLSFGIKFLFQLISIIVFIIIYYKVKKWVK